MSTKIIDVSSYQGNIDWTSIKNTGVKGAILKIIMKTLLPDSKFENNWSGCKSAGIPIIGVYNYSYATTVEKAKTDAKAVIKVLNGRKTKVWLDVEDTCQKNLGQTLIDIINAYKEIIETAGLEFGVYTGLSFYNSYIKPYANQIKCNFWIARYPSSAQMNVTANPSSNYKPVICHTLEGWQYSSKGIVSGISGNVDMNIWYDEVVSNETEHATLPINKTKITYISHRITDNKWGNEIVGYNNTNSMGYSGVFGKSIDKVTIKLSQGTITYTAHRTDGKWGGEITGYSTTDTTKYAGSTNKPIDAIAIKANGIVGTLKYRVHTKADNKWWGWITGYSKTNSAQYAGVFGKEIDAIQIGIE